MGFPMLAALDGNDRNRKPERRAAAPVRGTYICDDYRAACCPCRPVSAGGYSAGTDGHCYHESTRRRIEWQGGPSAGAADDLAAWNRMGVK